MIEEIRKLVKEASKKETNYFGYQAWTHHIALVVKNAKLLAKKLEADEEIVELAALLHDYASILNKDWYLEHHRHGARLAGRVLKNYGYPKEKIEKVKHCILAHRASKKIAKKTTEAKILASADSMAHFNSISSLLYLAFVIHKMDVDQGTGWVLAKLERSWKRLMPEAKEMMREKYESIKGALCT